MASCLYFGSYLRLSYRTLRLFFLVRLGNSGLKVSKIILGTMQYGLKGWAEWVLDEEEAIQHIKYAYVYGASHTK